MTWMKYTISILKKIIPIRNFTFRMFREYVKKHLSEIEHLSGEEIVRQRYEKFRRIGAE